MVVEVLFLSVMYRAPEGSTGHVCAEKKGGGIAPGGPKSYSSKFQLKFLGAEIAFVATPFPCYICVVSN